jgi:L-alanine-DL-glutamate epimerase-like enolase superfamily enzyme
MVAEAGLRLTPHMGTGSPVVQAAALHFHAAMCRDLPCEFQSDLSGLLPDCFSTGWRISAGRALRPEREGLGVDIDEAALARHVARAFSYTAD